MKAIPLLELLSGKFMRLGRVPLQHSVVKVQIDGSAVLLEHTSRVVQHVIRIEDADLNTTRLRLDTLCILLAADLGTNHAGILEVVEQTAQLVVSSLLRHEWLELGPLDERGDAASVIAWNGVLGVTNQEREVELLQDFLRNDRGVTRLRDSTFVREWRTLRAGRWAAGSRGQSHAAIVVTVAVLSLLGRIVGLKDRQSVRANAALDAQKRGRYSCGLAVRR